MMMIKYSNFKHMTKTNAKNHLFKCDIKGDVIKEFYKTGMICMCMDENGEKMFTHNPEEFIPFSPSEYVQDFVYTFTGYLRVTFYNDDGKTPNTIPVERFEYTYKDLHNFFKEHVRGQTNN